ncbi:efflux RND transporter periplasmic adaptor subunit [Candidatus Cyanaurora vandensis]|uniref:efflux RND transporter periplasmic adaptor subunit n=1 Tax=Candidatus Cyanaurora vandensis TaxID=2714958 RepID=UPI002580048F|nr:efflux RND transporter periplasmic adaptor subunit [Candidatus Cyanaurora vandensis]
MADLGKTLPLWVGLGLLVGSLGLVYGLQTPSVPLQAAEEDKETPAVLTISTAAVQVRPVLKTMDVSGSVAPWEQLQVGSEVGGLRIAQVPVEEGQRVRRGQVLAVLNSDVLQAQVRQAQARLVNAQAQVRQQQANLKQNQARLIESDANYQSALSLSERGALSDQETRARRTAFESTQAQVDQAQQGIAVAQSVVAESKAAISQYQAQLAQTRILAPDNGWILKKDAYIGNISAVGTPLFTMARQSRLELNAQVPEADLPRLKVGQRVTVVSDADSSLKASGTIRQVGPAIDTTSRQAVVKIALNGNERLRPGMFVRAQVQVATVNSLTVPAQAVSMRQDAAQVFVLTGNKVQVRPVQVGERTGVLVEILSGLKAGERVVAAGGGYLKNGDTVKVTSLPN